MWVSLLEAIVIRLEAIASRLKAIAIGLEAIASRLEAVATRLELFWRPSQVDPNLGGRDKRGKLDKGSWTPWRKNVDSVSTKSP